MLNLNIFLNLKKPTEATTEQIKQVWVERINMLFNQHPVVLLGEIIVAALFTIVLWRSTPTYVLLSWYAFICIFSSLSRSVILYLYYKRKELLTDTSWLYVLTASIAMSGIAWGAIGSYMMPEQNIFHQAFIVYFIVGITAATNLLYSVIKLVYAIFIFLTFSPLILWLFFQSNQYWVLGFAAVIFLLFMLYVSHIANHLLVSTLIMRCKITSLKSYKNSLKKKVVASNRDLKKTLAIISSTLEATADGILVVNINGCIEYFNQQFLRMWNVPLDKNVSSADAELIDYVSSQITNKKEFISKIKYLYNNLDCESCDDIYFKDGRVFERFSKPHKLNKKIVGRVWSFRDITLRTKLAHQANHDSLTGLPNRMALVNHIQNTINYANNLKKHVAILFLDIDSFKWINDNLGHDAGDILLKKIARRLHSYVRENDTVARFGGDEFVIIIVLSKQEDATILAHKILEKVKKPINLGKEKITVTVSIGISMYPTDGSEASTLLKSADLAMYSAKNKGRNNFQLYQTELDQ